MLLVAGVYCPFVGHRCADFIDEEKDICREYAPEVLCEGRLQRRRYCMDEFEYPNIEGVYPAVMADFGDAISACAVEGKRLCSTEEWEFACEGPQMWPYPYGLVRDPTACNIDRPHPEPNLPDFSDPWKISAEVDRLDQRVRSGELARCVSPFGIRDMTGNVDEWVVNEAGKRDEKPFRSALKGGYWGPIRARCRPMTSTHNEWFSFYQVGFRCCADPLDHVAVAPPPPNGPRRQRLVSPR
jgi:sulfatase modifying factor 1